MFRIPLHVPAIALSAVLMVSGVSRAAEGAATGNGRVVITRPPQVLRMQVTLTSEGKDIAEAVARMKEQQAALAKRLAELGASEKSVETGPAQVGGGGGGGNPIQQYVESMTGRQRGRAKPSTQPAPVSLSSTVKAEWALKAGSPEELLIASYALQEKIKTAAAAAKKEAKAMTPEEQEAMEEAAGMQMNSGSTAAPGEPSFRYVCKVSEEDRAAAMAEAFQKAKADAALLAKAAGMELGALKQLTSSITSPTANADNDQQAYMKLAMRQMGVSSPDASDTAPDEAAAPIAEPVQLQIVLTASFELK